MDHPPGFPILLLYLARQNKSSLDEQYQRGAPTPGKPRLTHPTCI